MNSNQFNLNIFKLWMPKTYRLSCGKEGGDMQHALPLIYVFLLLSLVQRCSAPGSVTDTGPPSALYYICDYMGGRTCWDTPIYHIWLHSYPLNIQSKVSKSPFLVVSCTICNLLQVSNSSLPLAMEWRIHRRKRSIWNIPEDFLISASSPHWPMKFQWSF